MSQSKQQLGYEAVLKALKAHSNAVSGGSDEEIEAEFEAFKGETDRGAVILAATTLEDKLTELFQAQMMHLNSDERSRLFGWDGPLGTFAAKVRMAHALKYFDRRTFKIAEVVREMRNACAHSRQDISFRDEALRDGILLLAQMTDTQLQLEANPSIFWRRTFFLTIVAWLISFAFSNGENPTFANWVTPFWKEPPERRNPFGETPHKRSSRENRGNQKGS
jgi:hypothetical protein